MTTQNAPQVANIFTFSLLPGVTDGDYLKLSAPSHDYMKSTPGYLARNISKSADGQWTDYIVWDSVQNAEAANSKFMEQDFAPAMVGAIAPETFETTQQRILWTAN